MSSNLAVVNFTVGGTLTVSGSTTLASPVLSSSSGSFQGLSTTTLGVSGTSTFNNSLPTSTQTPTSNTQLTTKVYVDSADTVVNNRITSVDSSRKTYIDDADTVLNNRITSVDSSRKTYIDTQDTAQFSQEHTWSERQTFSKLPFVANDLIPTFGNELAPRSYVDSSIRNGYTKPIFYVYYTSPATFSNNTVSRVRFDGVLFNLFSKYTSDYFFTPTTGNSGYYMLSTTISFPNITSGYIAIYKNGVEYSRSNAITSSSPVSLSVSTIMYFRNNTDSADVRIFCSPANSFITGQSNSFFTGSFIQPLFGTESFGELTPLQRTVLIVGGSGGNTISLSNDNGVSWTLPNNQPFTSRGYNCGFDGKRIVMGGNADIAYSDDYGLTWVSTGFTSIAFVYRVTYIADTKIWFATGFNNTNNQTIAQSSDGINWTLLSSTVFNRGRTYNIIYNGSVYIAVGYSSTYPMATSTDGITWTLNTSFKLDTTGTQEGYCLFYDGSRYIFGGGAPHDSLNPSNIAISQDGVSWDDTNKIYVPFDVRAISYNGVDTYVACGSKNGFIDGTIFYYWSNDLINWTPANNNLIGDAFDINWNGEYFVITGTPLSGSTVNIIYSADGKNWTASDNTQFTQNVFGISSITY